MGSNLMIDLLNFNSSDGDCKILLRADVQKKIATNSQSWNTKDVLLYAALSGCDFIPHLFKKRYSEMDDFMKRWKDPSRKSTLDEMLTDFAAGEHWPAEEKGKGLLATNYAEKVQQCIGLMSHAPVSACINGDWKLVPMRPLPPDSSWNDIIGFDPVSQFSLVLVEASYKMTV